MKLYNYVYKTTNLVNNKIYIGVHGTNKINDGYLGSGKIFLKALKKYKKDNFKKDILKFFVNIESALEYEKVLVTEEFVNDDNNYNLQTGGLSNIHFSQETKNKMSKLRKQLFLDEPIRRLILSKQKKELWKDEEYRERMEKMCKDPIIRKKRRDNINAYIKNNYEEFHNRVVYKINKNPEKIRKMAETHRGMKRSDEAKKKMSLKKKGIYGIGKANCMFKGSYITPKGIFDSSTEAAKTNNITNMSLIHRCKYNNHKIINRITVTKCDGVYDEHIGKSWKEIGWGFKEK